MTTFPFHVILNMGINKLFSTIVKMLAMVQELHKYSLLFIYNKIKKIQFMKSLIFPYRCAILIICILLFLLDTVQVLNHRISGDLPFYPLFYFVSQTTIVFTGWTVFMGTLGTASPLGLCLTFSNPRTQAIFQELYHCIPLWNAMNTTYI